MFIQNGERLQIQSNAGTDYPIILLCAEEARTKEEQREKKKRVWNLVFIFMVLSVQ